MILLLLLLVMDLDEAAGVTRNFGDHFLLIFSILFLVTHLHCRPNKGMMVSRNRCNRITDGEMSSSSLADHKSLAGGERIRSHPVTRDQKSRVIDLIGQHIPFEAKEWIA